MKLSQYIAYSLGISRRAACALINDHLITVNNEPVHSYSHIITDSDIVQYKDKTLEPPQQRTKYNYYKFYKPRGVVTSQEDLAEYYNQINPNINNLKYAGRLDKDSEGLLILTNDGDFIQELTHPRKNIKKYYQVIVRDYKAAEQIQRMRSTRVSVSITQQDDPKEIELKFVLTEGKNRQIRKLCAGVGLDVIKLKRLQVGDLKLDKLRSGQSQIIQPEQIVPNYVNNK